MACSSGFSHLEWIHACFPNYFCLKKVKFCSFFCHLVKILPKRKMSTGVRMNKEQDLGTTKGVIRAPGLTVSSWQHLVPRPWIPLPPHALLGPPALPFLCPAQSAATLRENGEPKPPRPLPALPWVCTPVSLSPVLGVAAVGSRDTESGSQIQGNSILLQLLGALGRDTAPPT